MKIEVFEAFICSYDRKVEQRENGGGNAAKGCKSGVEPATAAGGLDLWTWAHIRGF